MDVSDSSDEDISPHSSNREYPMFAHEAYVLTEGETKEGVLEAIDYIHSDRKIKNVGASAFVTLLKW